MLVLSFVLCIIASFLLGYELTNIKTMVNNIKILTEKRKEPESKKVTSVLIDPDDPIQQARFEHEQLMKKLNPTSDDE